jgi:hypothetical protein
MFWPYADDFAFLVAVESAFEVQNRVNSLTEVDASGAGNVADMIIDAQLKFAKHSCRANF